MDPVSKVNDKVKIQTALISVFFKEGLEDLILGLVNINPAIEIISTGGTYTRINALVEKGLIKKENLMEIKDYNGFPEIDGGLVKTLSRKVSMSLLTDTYNENHQERNKIEGVKPFDLVVCNLYPFQDADKKTIEIARINEDIGGPTMLREGAKNFLRVLPVVLQEDYSKVVEELKKNDGCSTLEMRFEYQKKVWPVMADYNAAIAEFMNAQGTEALKIYELQ